MGIGFNAKQKTSYTSIAQNINLQEDLLPSDIETILAPVIQARLLFVFDEFDNITSKKVRQQFADLIKLLSDNYDNITIVIIGISESVVGLIGSHKSLERCLKQIKMPRMSGNELGGIIDNGIRALELKIKPETRKKIIDFSTGFPHYTHLLCKYGCKDVIEKEKITFNDEHLNIATFSSQQESQWEEVLFACSTCYADEYNCFTIRDIIDQFSKNTGKPEDKINITYNLGKLCQLERGKILEKITLEGSVRYRFTNPLSKAFVVLKIQQKENS